MILPYIEQDNVVLHDVHTLGILTINGNMRGRLAALHVMDEGGMTTILQIGLARL